jgi:hypothetical protein
MLDQPQIVETAAQHLAFIPIVIPRSQVRAVMMPGRQLAKGSR